MLRCCQPKRFTWANCNRAEFKLFVIRTQNYELLRVLVIISQPPTSNISTNFLSWFTMNDMNNDEEQQQQHRQRGGHCWGPEEESSRRASHEWVKRTFSTRPLSYCTCNVPFEGESKREWFRMKCWWWNQKNQLNRWNFLMQRFSFEVQQRHIVFNVTHLFNHQIFRKMRSILTMTNHVNAYCTKGTALVVGK
jgi:hypothetical protein